MARRRAGFGEHASTRAVELRRRARGAPRARDCPAPRSRDRGSRAPATAACVRRCPTTSTGRSAASRSRAVASGAAARSAGSRCAAGRAGSSAAKIRRTPGSATLTKAARARAARPRSRTASAPGRRRAPAPRGRRWLSSASWSSSRAAASGSASRKASAVGKRVPSSVAPPFDDIAEERERRAGEADQRRAGRELAAQQRGSPPSHGRRSPRPRAPGRSASTAAAVRTGRSSTGPGAKPRPRPRPSSGVMMSENRIAASSGKRRIGCSVASAASSGVRISVEEVVPLAQRAVLRQVAAGLAQDPDRGVRRPQAAAGGEERRQASPVSAPNHRSSRATARRRARSR